MSNTLCLRDKSNYHILNGQPTEIETEVKHKSVKLTQVLTKLLCVFKERHYDVFDFDTEFWISHTNTLDSGKDLRDQTYHIWRINSEKFGFDCHFSSYDLSITLGTIKIGHDTDMKSCIWVYSGSDWDRDKNAFFNMYTKATVECEKYFAGGKFYQKYMKEVIDRLDSLIKKIEIEISKKDCPFKFNLPNKRIVCDTFGSYALFLNHDEFYSLLINKKIRLGGAVRLVSYGIKLPEGLNKIVQDGWRYCPIIGHDNLLSIEDRNTCLMYSSDSKYPVLFRPKFTNGLYIVDREASGPHDDQRFNVAASIVPYQEYENDYKSPQLIVHRDIFEDELVVSVDYYKNRYHELKETQEEWKKDYIEENFCEKFLKSQKEYITFDNN